MKENIINIPLGNTREEIQIREQIIFNFYNEWKVINPTLKKFNISLNEYINIRRISIVETAEHAAKTYMSTLAVLQLDAILANAKKIAVVRSKVNTKNQNQFAKMIIMGYDVIGIGTIKMTVGIKRSNNEKIQYCITKLDVADPMYDEIVTKVQKK